MGAFDQPRNIGNRSAAIFPNVHYPDDRMKRGKRVRRDLGSCRGNLGEQRRLAGVGITDEPGIGNRAQFEPEVSTLTVFAVTVLDRRAVTRALEMHIALAALAALGQEKFGT